MLRINTYRHFDKENVVKSLIKTPYARVVAPIYFM